MVWSLSGITVITTELALKINQENINASNFWNTDTVFVLLLNNKTAFFVPTINNYRTLNHKLTSNLKPDHHKKAWESCFSRNRK